MSYSDGEVSIVDLNDPDEDARFWRNWNVRRDAWIYWEFGGEQFSLPAWFR